MVKDFKHFRLLSGREGGPAKKQDGAGGVRQAGAEHGGGDGGLCAEAGSHSPYDSQQGGV